MKSGVLVRVTTQDVSGFRACARRAEGDACGARRVHHVDVRGSLMLVRLRHVASLSRMCATSHFSLKPSGFAGPCCRAKQFGSARSPHMERLSSPRQDARWECGFSAAWRVGARPVFVAIRSIECCDSAENWPRSSGHFAKSSRFVASASARFDTLRPCWSSRKGGPGTFSVPSK